MELLQIKCAFQRTKMIRGPGFHWVQWTSKTCAGFQIQDEIIRSVKLGPQYFVYCELRSDGILYALEVFEVF